MFHHFPICFLCSRLANLVTVKNFVFQGLGELEGRTIGLPWLLRTCIFGSLAIACMHGSLLQATCSGFNCFKSQSGSGAVWIYWWGAQRNSKGPGCFFACNLIWGWFRPLAPGGALKLMNLTMVSLRWRFQDAWLLINYSPWPSITVGSNQSPCCFFDCLCFVTQQISNRAGRNHWEAWKLWHNPGKRSEVQRGHMADMAWPRFGAALLRRSNMSDIFAFYCRILQQEQELAYSVIRLTKRY